MSQNERIRRTLMPADANAVLKLKYQSVFPRIQELALKHTGLNWPHFVTVPESYAHSPIKLMVVGQQTKGWGPSAQYSTVEEVMAEYTRFDPSTCRKSPFWRAAHDLNDKIHEGEAKKGFIWSNLVKIAQRKGRPEFDIEEAICGLELLQTEIDTCKPDAVVFFTGPKYDGRLCETFKKASLLELSKLISHVSHTSLPDRCYRVYHPGYLQRSKNWHAIDDLVKLVSKT